jgi:hypothetical protein
LLVLLLANKLDVNSVSIDAKTAVFILMLAHIQGQLILKYPNELKLVAKLDFSLT